MENVRCGICTLYCSGIHSALQIDMVISITCSFMWVVPFRDEGLFPNCCCHGDTEMDPALWNSHLLLIFYLFFFIFYFWLSLQKGFLFLLALFSAPFSKWCFSLRGSGGEATGKRTTTWRLIRPPLHLPPLCTVGFNSAIVLPLMLLALLMPTTLLLKTVNLCLLVAVATALFFLVLHPDRFLGLKALFAFRLQLRTIPPAVAQHCVTERATYEDKLIHNLFHQAWLQSL